MCTPRARPWYSRNRLANSVARSASGPTAVTRSAGAASSSRDGDGMAAPKPPKHRPNRPRRSSTPKWSRAGVSTKTLLRSDILSQELHGFPLARSRRLIDHHLKACELLRDLLRWKQMGPGSQDRRLEHRIASPVEADEFPPGTPMNHLGLDARSWRGGIDRDYLQLAPGAGSVEDDSTDHCCGKGRKLGAGYGSLGEQHRVIGKVYHRCPGGAHVLERGRFQKRLEE